MPPPPPPPRSLLDTSLAAAAAHPSDARLTDPEALAALPEELLLELLRKVIAGGRLTPRIADAFRAVADGGGHAALGAFIASLRLRDPPPLVPSAARRWLGDKPGLY
jgi:hypothetical protein